MQQAGGSPSDDPPFADLAELDRLLLSTQTPAHRAQAGMIFERLVAGADIEDVEPLIATFDDIAPKSRRKSQSDDMRTHRFPKIGGDRHHR